MQEALDAAHQSAGEDAYTSENDRGILILLARVFSKPQTTTTQPSEIQLDTPACDSREPVPIHERLALIRKFMMIAKKLFETLALGRQIPFSVEDTVKRLLVMSHVALGKGTTSAGG